MIKRSSFETNVQEIKYKVLKEVAINGFKSLPEFDYQLIAKKIIPGPKATFRCCIHKERAIIEERLKIVTQTDKSKIIEVVPSACDQCQIHRYNITDSCRGCLARSCEMNCPVNAIYFIDNKAYINYELCIECGKCKSSCSFDAVSDVLRPCVKSCPVNAIMIDENKQAQIDYDKCISCGQCVFKCPFGAITDTSHIYDIAKTLTSSNNTYALIAPAISSQFSESTIGQVTSALKSIGFKDVIEVALGADMVVNSETLEFRDKCSNNTFMTTSCCPAFYNLIHKNYPNLKNNISSTISPMVAIGKLVKQTDKFAKTVFIGPCISKKHEVLRNNVNDTIDYVMTFEELRALIGAKNIIVNECSEHPLNNASYYSRLFPISGGVSNAIISYITDNNIDIDIKPIIANGSKECIKYLKIANMNKLPGNFIEGMMCEGGCISGPGSISHQRKDLKAVKSYAEHAKEKSINDSLNVIDTHKINMH